MTIIRRLAASFITVVMVTACASTQGLGSGYMADDTTPEGELLGDYLAGRYAYHIDDNPSRLKYYGSAFDREPDSAALGSKAVNAAISSGDTKIAKRLARRVLALDPSEALSRIVISALDMKDGKYGEAAERLNEQPDDPSLGVMMAMMEGWAEHGAGNSEEALAIFNSIEVGGYFDVIASLQNAQIYSELGDFEKAENIFTRVEKTGISPISVALAKVQFLSDAGRLEDALTYLKTFDKNTLGGVESGPVRTALDRLQAGQALPKGISAAQHASAAIVDPAGEFFYQQRGYDAAEIYLRTALMLDPNNHRARLWLAATLEKMERISDAEEVYAQVPDDSDYIVSATLSYANVLVRQDEDAKAQAMLRRLNDKAPTFLTREALGLSYLIDENYEKALPYFDAMVKSMTDEELQDNPQPLYHRGICLEQAERWEDAVSDFERVLEINPDSADTLNYLGYTWVDRGENLEKAFTMIRKAVELEPESGAIIDSLGWAHYKLGQYGQARIHLEDAAAKSPSSATIIDHLGDVYWRLGRFREAGYQWERALGLDPTDKERVSIKAKLKGGLSAAKTLP